MMDVPGKRIDRAGQRRSLDKLILDLNSSVSETCGHRERAVSADFYEASAEQKAELHALVMCSHL